MATVSRSRVQERLTYSAGVHWGIFLLPAAVLGLVWVIQAGQLAALAYPAALERLWGAANGMLVERTGWELAPVLVIVLAMFGITLFGIRLFQFTSTKIGVTTQRLLIRRPGKGMLPVHLARVRSVVVEISLLGRLLNFGAVAIVQTQGRVLRVAAVSSPRRLRMEINKRVGAMLTQDFDLGSKPTTG